MEGRDTLQRAFSGVSSLSFVHQAAPGPTLLLGITVSLIVAALAFYLLFRNQRAGAGRSATEAARAVYEVAGLPVRSPLRDARGPVS